MADRFLAPGMVISGAKALEQAAGPIARMGKKALIVTDGAMERLGNRKKVTDLLEQAGIAYAVFQGISGEPDDGMIGAGAACYREEGCDFLVGLGGGSVLDSMKAIAMIGTWGGTPADYLGRTVEEKPAPMAAVPTTAGTGSEVTEFAIITDRATQVKMLLKGPGLIPELAIVDPAFTMTAPKGITASTGIDALTHAIEAYTSKRAQPLSDTFALSACRRIFADLERVWDQGDDEEGRTQMALAALEAGLAFSNASVTLVHGMSRPIGALFHVPHGISNAMLLGVCLEYIKEGALDRMAQIARHCGLAGSKTEDRAAADRLTEEVERLLGAIQIPTLEEYGIPRAAFFQAIPKMAGDAMASGSPSNTRRPVDQETVEQLYRRLWRKEETEG